MIYKIWSLSTHPFPILTGWTKAFTRFWLRYRWIISILPRSRSHEVHRGITHWSFAAPYPQSCRRNIPKSLRLQSQYAPLLMPRLVQRSRLRIIWSLVHNITLFKFLLLLPRASASPHCILHVIPTNPKQTCIIHSRFSSLILYFDARPDGARNIFLRHIPFFAQHGLSNLWRHYQLRLTSPCFRFELFVIVNLGRLVLPTLNSGSGLTSSAITAGCIRKENQVTCRRSAFESSRLLNSNKWKRNYFS